MSFCNNSFLCSEIPEEVRLSELAVVNQTRVVLAMRLPCLTLSISRRRRGHG